MSPAVPAIDIVFDPDEREHVSLEGYWVTPVGGSFTASLRLPGCPELWGSPSRQGRQQSETGNQLMSSIHCLRLYPKVIGQFHEKASGGVGWPARVLEERMGLWRLFQARAQSKENMTKILQLPMAAALVAATGLVGTVRAEIHESNASEQDIQHGAPPKLSVYQKRVLQKRSKPPPNSSWASR